MAKRKVKTVQISHGLLGNPNKHRIEKAINKWMGKGYNLQHQQDERGGCLHFGYTLLTFIRED